MENITEYTREHSDKNIGSESQNALTVNETQLKMKQFPFNIAHLNALIHSTQHFLQKAKVAISGCKTKQSLLQALVYKFFQGKKPLSILTFKYLNQQLTAWPAPPQMRDLSVSQNVSDPFSLSFLCALMIHLVTDIFRSAPLSLLIFVFCFTCPPCDPAGFGSIFVKTAQLCLHAVLISTVP